MLQIPETTARPGTSARRYEVQGQAVEAPTISRSSSMVPSTRTPNRSASRSKAGGIAAATVARVASSAAKKSCVTPIQKSVRREAGREGREGGPYLEDRR